METNESSEPQIPLEHVESTAIEAIGYDAATQTLEVKFLSGKVYEYAPVTPDLYQAFLAAPSKGAFFNEQIKGIVPLINMPLV